MEHNGKGVDRKAGRKDGLRFRWQWVTRDMRARMSGRKREPCQTCETHENSMPHRWSLEVVAWAMEATGESCDYEAVVRNAGNRFAGKEHFTTRPEAQKGAELLLEQCLVESLRDCFGYEINEASGRQPFGAGATRPRTILREPSRHG